jgi:hypothetical protein
MNFSRWSKCAAACAVVGGLIGLTRGVANRVFVTLPPPPGRVVETTLIRGSNAGVRRSRSDRMRGGNARAQAAIDHAWALAQAVPPRGETASAGGTSAAGPLDGSAASVGAPYTPPNHEGSILVTCEVDRTDVSSVADALQACIDKAPPYSAIEIPPGVYALDRQLVIASPVTIRTADSAGGSITCARSTEQEHCAILLASPQFADDNGLLFVGSTADVKLEHLVIDGNHSARMSSTAATFCLNGFNTFGFNAAVIDCAHCALDDVLSTNALCGTGMLWSGTDATIERSEFRGNGSAAHAGLWADGLTLVYAPDSTIVDNRFVDNSDVALILGFGPRARVEGNVITQRGQASFAGLMLHNFHSDDLHFRGDFRGALIDNNTIDCGVQLCVFGIQIGPRPWDDTRNIVGGEVFANTVTGAKVGINVDGAGSRMAPTAVYANAVTHVPSNEVFSACDETVPTDWMNVAPTSVVDRRNDLMPTGEHLSYLCQLSSVLVADPPP